MLLGWVAALAGTLGYGAGSVLQGYAATRGTGPAVIRHPAYLAGLGCDGIAWAASLVAFRVLPLLVVQALLAGSVAVTVLLARVVLGTRLRGRDLLAIALLVGALACLASAFTLGTGAPPAGLTGWTLLALGLVGLLLAAGYRAAGSVPLAVLAGAAFSGTALSVRALDLSTATSLPGQPLAWAVLGYGALGTLAYARSLERGPVGPATAVLWAVETVLAGLLGAAVLGDPVRAGWDWVVATSVPVVVLGCLVLATGPAHRAPCLPVPDGA